MKQKLKEYQVGQLVFAKIRGYPSWPAKITERNKNSYGIFFYGTNETASLSSENIFAYEENKEKFITAKSLKRRVFEVAVNEIETIFKRENNKASASTDIPSKKNLKRKSNVTVEDYGGASSQRAKRTSTPVVSDQAEVVTTTPPPELIINNFIRRFISKITPKQKTFYVQLYDFFQNRKLCQLLDVERIINNNKHGIEWNRFEEHERIPLMLLQHPKVMDNIRRSRLFTEDLRPFNLEHCESESTPEVEKIRQNAVDIYNNLKIMFKENDLKKAWDKLCTKINNFRRSVMGTDDEIFLSLMACTYLKILTERNDDAYKKLTHRNRVILEYKLINRNVKML